MCGILARKNELPGFPVFSIPGFFSIKPDVSMNDPCTDLPAAPFQRSPSGAGLILFFFRSTFWILMAVWTVMLLTEDPLQPFGFRHGEISSMVGHGDKLLHVTGYLVLSLLGFRGYGSTGLGRRFVLISCTFHGAFTEIFQRWIPGRHSDLLDWLADLLGLAVAVGCTAWFRKMDR